ncbi:MAG TPA: M28 family peptidase [Gemmatimonadaceae bacterium]|nr:M28 family peptidase [Gemmatimonadaceae bacterium]
MTRRALPLLLLSLAVAGCGASRAPRATAPAAAAGPSGPPTAEELRRDLAVFASDSFRGRRTGTPDELRAASFIATRLAALGLEPAGDSGFFQLVPLLRPGLGPATRFEVRTAAGGVDTLAAGQAFFPIPSPARAEALPATRAEGDVVFLGYGVPTARTSRDALDRVDVAGKVVVVVSGAPREADAARRATLESAEQVGRLLAELIPRRPAAVVVLLTGAAAKVLPQLARQYARLAHSDEVYPAPPDSVRTLPMLVVGDPSRAGALLPAGWTDDDRPRALAGVHFSGFVDQEFNGHNVVGIVRGRDPALRSTYVAYGAHLDHIGVMERADSGAHGADSIANGADDDGSGSVSLLALARTFVNAPRPRRSVLFVWHTGEEEGLFGSERFTAHPPVPLDSIVAQLNADMIGRNAPDSLYLVGPVAAPKGQSRVLGEVVDSVNASLPRPFRINREWDSPTHPEQIYYRSDHFNYARRGIPIVFFTSGLHADYHRVSDEVDKIDFDKMARVCQLLLGVGRAVGEREGRLK